MDGNTIALLGLYEDITDRKAMEHQLRELAHHDTPTGLANRAVFHHHLELAVAKSRREGSLMALLYFDFDHFKDINDSFGHDMGDAVLKAFAQRVTETVREADVFGRLGGDEFALLLENLPNPAAAGRVGNKLVASMQLPYQLGERTIAVSSSIGLAFFQRGMRADELIRRADQAMYDAKRGRNRVEISAAPLNASATPRPLIRVCHQSSIRTLRSSQSLPAAPPKPVNSRLSEPAHSGPGTNLESATT